MAIATGNPVKFVYVTGNTLPATPNQDTIYFVAGAQQLYVGAQLIADHIDISGKQDNITVTTSGTGDYVANVTWDAATSTFTVTKATLPQESDITIATATGSGSFITALSANGHEITPTLGNVLTGATVAAAPTTDLGVVNKKYVDDAVAGVTGAMHFVGTSTTAITDGGTQDPTIDGQPVTEKTAGDVVLYNGLEFVWDGSKWNQLGDEGSYALKTTQVIAGTGLTGGGALTGDVTLAHQDLPASGTADDISADVANQHLYVMTGVDKDALGHVVSVNEKDIFSTVQTIAQNLVAWEVVA